MQVRLHPRTQASLACNAMALTALAPSALPPFAAAQSANLTSTGIVLVLGFLVLSLGIHEAAHGWVAWKRGDSTAKDLGRITLNPIPHIDPIMTILLPAALYFMTRNWSRPFVFGGAKPVPVVAHRLRHPLRDMVLVALAGPGSNFLLAILFVMVWKAVRLVGSYRYDAMLPQVLLASASFNVVLAVFNLVPVPPLDGSRVMTWLLPPGLREPYAGLERFGLLLVIVLMWIPGFPNFLMSGVSNTLSLIDRMTGGVWGR